MQTKCFGANRTPLPVLGLGCARIGSFNNPAPARDTALLLERALDMGVCLFDTADVYGQGDSERAIGRLLRQRREAGFVVTKAGILLSGKMLLIRPLKPILKPILSATSAGRAGMTSLRQHVVRYDFTPDRIVAALEASLRRLKTDAVDAFLLHGPSPETIRDARTIEMLWRLRRDGKLKSFGVSCDSKEALSAALEMQGLEMVEATPAMLDGLSPRERDVLRTRRIGVLIREALRERGAVPATRVVADFMRRTDVTCTIVGTTSIKHLEELASVASAAPEDTSVQEAVA